MARNPDTQIVADFADARWTLRVDELIPPADEKLECHADFSFRNRASMSVEGLISTTYCQPRLAM